MEIEGRKKGRKGIRNKETNTKTNARKKRTGTTKIFVQGETKTQNFKRVILTGSLMWSYITPEHLSVA